MTIPVRQATHENSTSPKAGHITTEAPAVSDGAPAVSDGFSETPLRHGEDSGSFLSSFGFMVILLAACGGRLCLWTGSTTWGLAPWSLFGLGCLLVFAGRSSLGTLTVNPAGLGAGLLVLFLSDWLTRGYNLIQGPMVRGEILLGTLLWWFLLRRYDARGIRRVLPFLAVAGSALLIATFFRIARGRLLFTDDHPAFLERLMLLKDHFPWMPILNPLWNAGYDARDFLPSGTLNVFFLFMPLVYATDLTWSYNIIVVSLLFVVGPLSAFCAARVLRLPIPAAAVGAVLTAAPHLFWYRWALKYGTMGFITSLALFPLVAALSIRAVTPGPGLTKRQLTAFVALVTLMLFWTPSGLAALPIGVVGLIHIRTALRRPALFVALAALVAINIPWMALFWSASNVGRFVVAEEAPSAEDPGNPAADPAAGSPAPQHFKRQAESNVTLRDVVVALRQDSIPANPLILLFGVGGLFLLPASMGLSLGIIALWLLALATVGAPLKPQLELDRMFIFLSVLLALPAGAAFWKLQDLSASSGITRRLLASLAGGFLLVTPLAGSAVVGNRSVERYFFEEPIVKHFATALRQFAGAGRVLFSGFVLHDLSHGHVTPLPLFAQTPLIASSPVHRYWKYQQIIPKEYLERGDSGITEYLDLMNVSAVVAHEREWREYFGSRPDHFTLVWHEPPFAIYRRSQFPDTYFLEGQGSLLSQQGREVVLRVDSNEAVVKFNYFYFLEAPPCTVSPEQISESISFVRLSHCQAGSVVRLRAVPPWRRLWLEK